MHGSLALSLHHQSLSLSGMRGNLAGTEYLALLFDKAVMKQLGPCGLPNSS
jgi:hypothetical protein